MNSYFLDALTQPVREHSVAISCWRTCNNVDTESISEAGFIFRSSTAFCFHCWELTKFLHFICFGLVSALKLLDEYFVTLSFIKAIICCDIFLKRGREHRKTILISASGIVRGWLNRRATDFVRFVKTIRCEMVLWKQSIFLTFAIAGSGLSWSPLGQECDEFLPTAKNVLPCEGASL